MIKTGRVKINLFGPWKGESIMRILAYLAVLEPAEICKNPNRGGAK